MIDFQEKKQFMKDSNKIKTNGGEYMKTRIKFLLITGVFSLLVSNTSAKKMECRQIQGIYCTQNGFVHKVLRMNMNLSPKKKLRILQYDIYYFAYFYFDKNFKNK
jgi:hypothetical protein